MNMTLVEIVTAFILALVCAYNANTVMHWFNRAPKYILYAFGILGDIVTVLSFIATA